MYDYLYSIIEDIKTVFDDYDWQAVDRDELAEEMAEELWTDDSVTGNGSGSYTFDRAQAKEYVTDNMELCQRALREFCIDPDTISEHFLNEDWEYFDVTIRCYLLNEAIDLYLTRFYDDFEEDESTYGAEVEIYD